jgi:hypothetical protein
MRAFLFGTVAAAAIALPLTADAGFVETFEGLTTNDVGGPFNIFVGTLGGSVSAGGNDSIGVFDTDQTPGTPPDGDLLSGTGNAIVIDNDGSRPPNDKISGGTFNFSGFNEDFFLKELTIIDLEGGAPGGERVDIRGGLNGTGTLLATITNPVPEGSPNVFNPAATQIAAYTPGLNILTGDPGLNLGTEFSIVTNGTVALDNISAVPLPGALVLFGAGAAVVGLVARRRQTADAIAT